MRCCCLEILTNCKGEYLMPQHETRVYILEVELKMSASQTVKE